MALQAIRVVSEHYGEKPTASMEWLCNWDERNDCVMNLVGTWWFIGGVLTWVWPATYPYNANLRCKSVECKPLSEEGDVLVYNKALLTVEYTVLDIPTESEYSDPEDLFTSSIAVSCEGLKLPKKSLEWSSGPLSGKKLQEEDTEVNLWMPFAELTIESPWLAEMKTDVMAEKVGHLNSGPFLIPNDVTIAEECVLFLGVNSSQVKTTEGYSAATRSLKFGIRAQTWKKVWCNQTSTWEDVSPNIYETTTFAELFT